jgi:hypothetical protein
MPDPLISDEELSHMLDGRILVRMPRDWGEPPRDPKVMAELRRRVATYRPPRRTRAA